MQFLKSVLLSTAFVATLASAAPASSSESQSRALENHDLKLAVESRDVSEVLPEKRLSWGKAAAGGAAAILGWFTTKEGQDFLNTSEGKAFASKLAVNDEEFAKRAPLNAAAMIGLTGGAVLKGIFGSKEAADAFLATEQGQELVSKLGTVERRGAVESRSPLNAAGLGASIFAATAIYNGLKGNFGSKEAADAFLNSPDGQEFVSKLATVERRDVEPRSPLNAAGIGASIFAGTAIYNGLKNNFGGSKEAVDAFLDTPEGLQYASKLAVESRDVSEVDKRLVGVPVYAKIAATLAGMAGAGTLGYKVTKEAQDIEARGKADYGSMIAAIISGFNAIRARDVGEDSLSVEDMEKRLTPAAKFAAAAIAASFGAGSVIKNIATRDVDADFDLLG